MALSNSQYDAMMRVYNQRQFQDKREQDKRIEEVYEKVPQVEALSDEIAATMAQAARKILAGDRAAAERLRGLDDPLHALLDLLEILRGERILDVEVVVEAVFDGRSDRHLRRRIQLFNGLSHQVRSRVADQLESFGVLCRNDGNLGIRFNDVRQIDELVVNLAGESRFGKAGTDGCCNVAHRERPFVLTNRTVGQSDGKHFYSLSFLALRKWLHARPK